MTKAVAAVKVCLYVCVTVQMINILTGQHNFSPQGMTILFLFFCHRISISVFVVGSIIILQRSINCLLELFSLFCSKRRVKQILVRLKLNDANAVGNSTNTLCIVLKIKKIKCSYVASKWRIHCWRRSSVV